jgi:metal-sulfur cluster biosynthetic enzyme
VILTDERHVLSALSAVRDPELDEPITDLGFVKAVQIDGDSVTVTLWLPTYWCAPNFAYLMAADAKAAVGALEGVGTVRVTLFDHHASEEINEGLAHARDFDETFAGDAAGTGLADLRSLFDRKSFLSRQERLHRSLVETGMSSQQAARLRIGDLPDTPEARRYLERRAWMGIDTSEEAPFLVTPDGKTIPEDEIDRHLRFARTVSVSIEGNASLCRGLLATRYGVPSPTEVRT